ncbi:MAG TPA: hypothetical protein GX697_05445, partial [Firmicutes bacterium]|nr:hypothetical protein [Bacillota bacterium]
MFCQECKMRPATVHLTKIINNVKQERHLCEVCAREADDFGISMEPKFTFHHLLTGLLGTEGTFYPGGEA